MIKKIKVSIIIPAKNEAKLINKTLTSLKKYITPSTEIIVVCNDCQDQTSSIAQAHGVKTINTLKRGVSHARNLGAQQSSGDFLLFLDADTTLSKNAIEFLVDSYKEDVAVSSLPVMPDCRKKRAYLAMQFKNICMTQWYPYSNGVIFCSRKIFNALDGFNEKMNKREDGDFMRLAVKKFGKFHVERRAYCQTSMRRYHKHGYLGVAFFWVKQITKELFNIAEYNKYDDVR